jgi:phosphatidylserine/phosphatidylglycerophosphate/cardiolipin synthase-like enzyme/uncharacterized membrane protein YdjX (TVP38/TMEM64 family)
VADARRLAFLVDVDDYFSALRHAVLAARRSVLIIGWDVDSRVRLAADPAPPDGYPPALLDFLNAVLPERPELHVHVLGWDFSMIYAFEREMLPSYKFGWRGHRRLHFALDAVHPPVASHHQKVVVVDDRVAFAGGVDLTIRRWDTSQHLARDPRRADPHGESYAPVHDLQMAVEGDAAAALGALARDRWRIATGKTLAAPFPPGASDGSSPWPPDLPPDLGQVPVGIARTAARGSEGGPVGEIARLTLEAIAAARRCIFIENQYLTSAAVGEALAERLAAPAGPEVVMVLPALESGWLEQSSMGILRARLLARLRQADHQCRLHVYHPVVPDLGSGCVNVHSKLLVIDDRLLKLGSANLSNRSMGLDTECDLVLEAHGSGEVHLAEAISRFRSRLLAEHLGVSPALVEERVAARGSVAAAVESLRGGERTLVPLIEAEEPLVNLALLDGLVCDPEQPIAADNLIGEFVPEEARSPAQRALRGLAAALLALMAVAALWLLSPVARWLGLEEIAPGVAWLRHHGLLYVLAAFLVGALLLVPGTLLIGATVLIYSWPLGVLYAFVASLLTAASTYALGWVLSPATVQRRFGPQTMWLRGQLRRGRVVPLALARLVPVGNFSVMGLVAGSLRVRFSRFMLGTMVGLLPGILALALMFDSVARALREPGVGTLALLVVVISAVGGALFWLARRLAASPVRARAPVLVPGTDR